MSENVLFDMKIALRILLICSLVGFVQSANSAEPPAVTFGAVSNGSVQISIGDMPFARFAFDDPEIPRPYLAQIQAPGGVQVTRNHPPDPNTDVADHPTFHPGLWLAFGDINGSDFWRNKAQVQYVADSLETKRLPGPGTFQAKFRYLDENNPDHVICEELLRCKIAVRSTGYLILWDSQFSGDEPFYFGDQEEMGLGVRVATSIRSETQERGSISPGNGKIVDAEGRVNGAEIWGTSSPWCDYSGMIEAKIVGVTLFCHPDNVRPGWFHARDYGLLVANLFGRRAFHHGEESRLEVAPDGTFRLRYGVFIYAVPQGERPDLTTAYQDYLKLAQEK